MLVNQLCPTSDEMELAVCNKANGYPGPAYPFGEGTPEGSITGYYPGMLYADTQNSKMYAFFGTAGADTGWVILN